MNRSRAVLQWVRRRAGPGGEHLGGDGHGDLARCGGTEVEARGADSKHPITRGIDNFRVKDEFYYRLKFVKPEGSVRPVLLVLVASRPTSDHRLAPTTSLLPQPAASPLTVYQGAGSRPG